MMGFFLALEKNVTFLVCSTVAATDIKGVEEGLREVGREDVLLVDCPVSGGPRRAADGTLSIMTGGSEAAVESGRALLEVMAGSGKLYLVDGGLGAGSNMKMLHQVLAGVHILAASEAMGFAARLGLDLEQVREAVVRSSSAYSWMFENRTPRMLKREFVPGASALTIILKDVVCDFLPQFMSMDSGLTNFNSRALSQLRLGTIACQFH